MPRRADIGIADLAKSLNVLRTESQLDCETIAECLGFSIGKYTASHNQQEQYHPTKGAWNKRIPQHQTKQSSVPKYQPGSTMPPVQELKLKESPEILDTTLIQQDDVVIPATNQITPDLLQNIETLLSESVANPPPRQLLFPKMTARSIVSESLMQPTPSGEIDIPKFIENLSKLRPIKQIPYKQRLSIQNGCQLLLDFSEALMPWWDDMHSLINQFQKVLGEQLCPVYEFDTKPSKAIQWTETQEIEWRPIKNRPIIIASDLGHINTPNAEMRSGKTDWLQLIKVCKKSDSPVIVLNPLHPGNWDNELSQNTAIIHWHQATTAADIKRSLQPLWKKKQ